jgi:3-oxoacyl-[acyl-carrier-protein] synthase-1
MDSSGPFVVAVGMTTPVGLSARETATSVRSGTARFAEVPLYDRRLHPFTMAEIPPKALPDAVGGADAALGRTSREQRLLRLGATALLECIGASPRAAGTPALVLALPETQTTRPLDGARFLAAFSSQCGGRFDADRSHAIDTGRAGGLLALARAAELIRTGKAEFMVAGAIDTFRDPYVLGTLDREQRVKSATNLDGFIPGEGAGFVLLASAQAVARHGLQPLARITPVALGEETGHLYSDKPYRGDGLAQTLAQLFASAGVAEPVTDVFSSMNGESHWAKEWGVGVLRNKAAFHEAHRMHHPADSFGDLGAAVGPVLVGLAAMGVAAGYRQSPCLVYASSDRAARAALLVQTAALSPPAPPEAT